MSVAPGSKLGPYEIVSRLGAGGMGEVWKARDTRLDRSVAIKILPAEFAGDTQFRVRFEREAKTISQLEHPHICRLYDVGLSGAPNYLVMELLEGESLADRVARGPLPLNDVLKYGAQIADALDRAHHAGVVHRDLKPGNIMITKSGAKLLDFGLAKSSALGGAPTSSSALNDGATEHRPLTEQGTILGTYQYMAPEQLAGEEADARTDVFALGALLYEMATGHRAFAGKNKTSLVGAIVGATPRPIRELQPITPPLFEHIVARCLEKDPDDRWQSAHDIASELRWLTDSHGTVAIAIPGGRRRREWIAWGSAAILMLIAAAALLTQIRDREEERARESVRSSIVGSDGRPYAYASLSFGPVVSPDGRRIAFAARDRDGGDALFVRSLTSLEAQPLAGTEGAAFPFWSPDSRFLAFFAGGKLKKIEATGGPVQTLASTRAGRGGTWNRDGVIVYSPDSLGPLFRVSAEGGTPVQATTIAKETGDTTHRWPSFLPDGKRFLYLDAEGSFGLGQKHEANAIWAGSLDPNEKPKRILTGKTRALYAHGHLLFVRDGFLLAQKFDAKKLALEGEPITLAEEVRQRVDITGLTWFTASDVGVLVYQGGAAGTLNLVWFDRDGKELGTIGGQQVYGSIRIAPDDARVAMTISDPSSGTSDIWVHEPNRPLSRRLTFDAANEGSPVWSPDSSKIVFASTRGEASHLILKSATGSTAEEVLLTSKKAKDPQDWSADGRYILFNQGGAKTDFWAIPLSGNRKPIPIVTGEHEEGWGRLSPDGRWVVYLTNETGQWEAFAMRFPPDGSGTKWQLTTTGADWIVGWNRNGRELFYIDLEGNIASLPITLRTEIEAGSPKPLFKSGNSLTWASTSDGSRFMIGREPPGAIEIPATLVVDWPAMLKR